MSNRTAPAKSDVGSFLAQDEEMCLSWQGILKESEEDQYPAQFAATNNRLVFSLGGGHFKDIGFQHIESVEVGTDIQTETDGTDPDSLMAIGGLSAIVGIGAIIVGGFSALATLVGVCLLGLGALVFFNGSANYDEMKDNLEVTEYPVYHILMRTSATSPFSMPIYIETRENVGPDLSRLVQESS